MWTKFRHKVVNFLLKPFFALVLKCKYGFRYKKYKLDKTKPYLILSNHQTLADQFFLSVMFNRPIYFIARSDLFSMSLVSKVLRYLVAPIPKNKVTKDTQTIRISRQIIKENGVVGLFPEGNLTFSGTTEYIDKSTAKFVKMLKATVLFVNIKGGYGVSPRWGAKVRHKGKITAEVVEQLDCDQYENMSTEQLYEHILSTLYVSDTQTEQKFISARKGEYLETVVFHCPKCGALNSFDSSGSQAVCAQCGYTLTYTDSLTFHEDEYFHNVKELYENQREFVSNFDFDKADKDKPLFTDAVRAFSEEKPDRRKFVLLGKNVVVAMYPDRITVVGEGRILDFPLDEIYAMAVLGRNKIELNVKNIFYHIKPYPRFNALKYVQFFYHYKNIREGNAKSLGEVEFLGL